MTGPDLLRLARRATMERDFYHGGVSGEIRRHIFRRTDVLDSTEIPDIHRELKLQGRFGEGLRLRVRERDGDRELWEVRDGDNEVIGGFEVRRTDSAPGFELLTKIQGPALYEVSNALAVYYTKKLPEAEVKFLQKAAHPLARRMKWAGMDISIETDVGDERHWTDPHNGEQGSTVMLVPYGYIRRTLGTDDDQVDVFVGPDESAPNAYVIHQMKAPDFTEHDEDKVILGVASPQHARALYEAHYNDPRFFGSMSTIPIEHFKRLFVYNRDEPIPSKE